MRRDDLTRYHGATVVSYASCNSEFAKACHTTSLFIKLQRTKTGNYTITLGCRVAHHARCAALGISPGDWEAISPISVIVMDHGTMARLKISVLKNIKKHQEFWFFVVKFPNFFWGVDHFESFPEGWCWECWGILIPMVVDICKGHKSPLTGWAWLIVLAVPRRFQVSAGNVLFSSCFSP